MPLYVEQLPEEGPYIEVTENSNSFPDKVRVRFCHRSKRLTINWTHRTDGPAVITWDKRMKGATKLYYIHGTPVDKDKFLEVLNAPFENLPLYLHDPILGEIAKDRLAGERTSFKLDAEHKHLTGMIEHHGKVLKSEQVLAKNLVTHLNKVLRSRIWDAVKDLKVLS